MEGSYYEGSWDKGSKIRFLGPGGGGGMFSEIADSRPHEFVSIRHLGEIRDGVDTPYDAEKAGYENYTLKEKNGGTELSVDLLNLPDEYVSDFNEMWRRDCKR
jgi:hypothetical protein